MINRILFMILILMSFSCSSSGWDSAEGIAYKAEYINICTAGGYTSESSCQCVLDKITAKYSFPINDDKIGEVMRDAYNFTFECY